MSLDDPTMGATFPSWTSTSERGSTDKMPAWGVPGEVQHAEQIALRFYHRNTGADLGFAHVGYIPSNASWAFLHGGVWQRIDTHSAWRLWRAGVQSLNGAPISGETPEEGEWPARDRVPMVRMDTMMVSAEPQTVEWSAPSDPSSWDEIRGACLDCGASIPAMDHKCSKCAGSVPNIGLSAMGLRPAEVTPEMVAAGQLILPHLVEEDIVEIFQAMHAAAPVPLVSDAEIALTRERDDALESAAHWRVEADRLANGPSTQHPPEFVAKVLMDREGRRDDPMAHARLTEVIRCARLDGRKQARDEIATLRAELMAAHDQLAKFTAQDAVEPEAPDPIANAIRPREVDPRRMGLA